MLSVDLSSILTIMSPARMPPRRPGVPTIGLMTISRPVRGSMPRWMPIAAELALGLVVELLVLVRVDVLRVRVEPVEPAVDHVLDELLLLLVVEWPDEVLVDLGEHVHDGADELVVLVVLPASGR